MLLDYGKHYRQLQQNLNKNTKVFQDFFNGIFVFL